MLTQDLGVCTVLSSSTIEKLRVAFRYLHPVHRFTPQRLSLLEHPEPGTPIKNLYLQTDLGPVDFLSDIDGVEDYDDVSKNAERTTLFDRKVNIISLNDLLKSKETIDREKDLIAVKELRANLEKKNQRN